jgi:hypothetical protein
MTINLGRLQREFYLHFKHDYLREDDSQALFDDAGVYERGRARCSELTRLGGGSETRLDFERSFIWLQSKDKQFREFC